MNALVLLLLLGAEPIDWPSVSTALPKSGGGDHDAAVVVGISNYAFLPEVAGAADNAGDWAQYLTRVRGVPIDRVILLRDGEATKERIERAAQRATSMATGGGLLWLILIGHGAPAGKGDDGVFLGVDTQAAIDSLSARGIAQRELLPLVKNARVVAIFDACFSGMSADGDVALIEGMQATVPVRRADPAASVVLSSSPTFAGPLPGTKRPAFSYLLLGALRGWADGNRDKSVTVDEAFSYVTTTLGVALKHDGRTPELRGTASKSMVLAAGVTETGPEVEAIVLGRCPSGTAWRGRACEAVACPSGLRWDGHGCVPSSIASIACPDGTKWNGSACASSNVVCPTGSLWTGAVCMAMQQSASVEETLAAKVAFDEVEESYRAFLKLEISARESKLQIAELEAKSSHLVMVEDKYKALIRTHRVATWSLAALYRVGSLYDNLAAVVRMSPCPDDVRRLAGEVACDEYRRLIDDRSFAVEEKAVEAYRTVHKKARELRLNDEWTTATLRALKRLRPEEFGQQPPP